MSKKGNNLPKIQHYVPCCYLWFFSATGTWKKKRKTRIYFTDGDKSKCVSVEDLARYEYTYSKETPEFDCIFHNIEGEYPKIVEKALNGRDLKTVDYYKFILTMMDFNLRNVSYENRTPYERKITYANISKVFLDDLFKEIKLEPERGEKTIRKQQYEWMKEYWKLEILEAREDQKFITSDNPSIIFSDGKQRKVVLVYLPIHPKKAFFAFDKRYIEMLSNKATVNDIFQLNALQAINCNRQLYADHDLLADEGDANDIKELLNRDRPERFVDEQKWKYGYIATEGESFESLSFIRRKEVVNINLLNAIREANKSY